MKIEKIEELWDKHSCKYKVDRSSNDTRLVPIEEFISAIKQAELKWYKKLEKRLGKILVNLYSPTVMYDTTDYYREIQNKVKELENEN